MNKHILLNTGLALLIPFHSRSLTVSALTKVLPTQKQQAAIAQSSSVTVSLLTPIIFNPNQEKKFYPTTSLSQPFLISSGGNVVNSADVDCNKLDPNSIVETSEGFSPASRYCQAQTNNRQQPALNIQNIPRPDWQSSYWSNGNVCRERSADTVCVTPQTATNLKWPTPSLFPNSRK